MTRRYSIVLGMAAIFREAAPYSGVGENLPTTAQEIVVPSGGSTLVILEDGAGLDVRSTMCSKVYVYEFDVFPFACSCIQRHAIDLIHHSYFLGRISQRSR